MTNHDQTKAARIAALEEASVRDLLSTVDAKLQSAASGYDPDDPERSTLDDLRAQLAELTERIERSL